MSATHVYQGMGVTPKYVTVYYADRIGAVDRVQSVKIPVAEFTRPELLDVVDKAIRTSLLEQWEGTQGEISLFPLDDDPPWSE